MKKTYKYCCDANIIAAKCVHFESVHCDQKQLLSTANAKDFNQDYYVTNSTLALRYHGSLA